MTISLTSIDKYPIEPAALSPWATFGGFPLEEETFYVIEYPFTGVPGDVERIVLFHSRGCWISHEDRAHDQDPMPAEFGQYKIVAKLDLWRKAFVTERQMDWARRHDA